MQSEMLEVAQSLVKECGSYLKNTSYQSIAMKEGIADLVTDKDRSIEAYLVEQLSLRYPSHKFLGE